VHITGATLALLAGAYAVEDVAMEHRDPYLRELGEPTYLVIDPRVKAQFGLCGLNQANHPQAMPELEFLCPNVYGGGDKCPRGVGRMGKVHDLHSQISHAPG
jgi:hypothetical protein